MMETSKFKGLKVGLVQFPGSNCDWDCQDGLRRHFGIDVSMIWHRQGELPENLDALILPGGFSYGDYLRGGSLASLSPVMKAVYAFAKEGRPIIGICNGFQILCEAKLLPGVLLKNESSLFVCRQVELTVASGSSGFHKNLGQGRLRLPVAHGEGRYYTDGDSLKKLQDSGQILLTYQDNPNGSLADIAAITNSTGRIIGMMPHPERAMDDLLGGSDGRRIWQAFLSAAL